MTQEDLIKNLRSKKWRMNNLYWIIDKDGKRVKFKFNWAQELFYRTMWYLCIILKARQLGFTTFICIFALDECLFNPNVSAGIIAHNREDAESFFDRKVKYPYDNLPEIIRQMCPAENDTARTLKFKNHSMIRVGTSMRSGTLNILHVSEFGKICAQYPKKAQEIVTGAFNTVQAGQRLFIESTAEGAAGYYYDYCQTAMSKGERNAPLSKLDFKFYFFPWWKHPEYRIDPEYVEIPASLAEYFEQLRKQGIVLDSHQRAWYAKKKEQQKGDMTREYPSTPNEAFASQIEGCWFADVLDYHHKTKPGVFGTLYQDKGGEPYFEEEPDGIIEIWRHPYHLTHPDANYWQDRYVVGSDIGEGLNQDSSVAYVFDRVLQEFVCRMASNKVDAVTWAEMLEELAWYYKGFRKHDPPRHANVEYKIVPHQAFIVPERTGAGITTCKKLHDNNANVFVHMDVAKSGKPVTKKVGWVETRQSKFDLLGDLREYLGTTSSTVYCGTLLAECGVYIHDKETGQLGAAEGYHDDHVIAGALAVKGHYLMESPQEIEPPEAGWRLKMQKEGRSAWAA